MTTDSVTTDPVATDPVIEPEAPTRLALPGGAYAEVQGSAETARLSVYSPNRQLVFEYDPHTGRTCVNIPDGDLVLRAPNGSVTIDAAGPISMQGEHIDLRGQRSASLSAGSAGSAGVAVQPERIAVHGQSVDVTTQRGSLQSKELRCVAERLSGRYGQVDTKAKVIRESAERIIRRSRYVYQRVEKLAELVAGRVRTLVSSAWQVRAERIDQQADKDVRIDGEKIDIG